jgi:hypothetical protein
VKEFFLILFLAKSVAITPEPINISNGVTFHLAEPVSAITSGAHLRIDVSGSLARHKDVKGVVNILQLLEEEFPQGSITGALTTAEGDTIILDRLSGSTDGLDAELILASSVRMPADIEFTEITLNSSVELIGVTITWRNHSK